MVAFMQRILQIVTLLFISFSIPFFPLKAEETRRSSLMTSKGKAKKDKKSSKFSRDELKPPRPKPPKKVHVQKGKKGTRGKLVDEEPILDSPFIKGFKYDVFVDASSTQIKQDGSIARPFKTIQAAINSVCAKRLENPEDSYTILITDGVYKENLVINGNNKRINLVAFNHVVLGTSKNGNTITWNMDDSSNNINPELSLNVLTLNTAIVNTVPGVNKGYTGQFHIEGNIQITSNAIYPLTANLLLTSVYVNGKINYTGKATVQELGLFLNQTTTNGINPNKVSGVNLHIAEHVHMNQELNIDNFGRIHASSIRDGMTLLQAKENSSGVEPEGILLTKFSGKLQAPKGAKILLDSYTNYWFQANKVTPKTASVQNVHKIVASNDK